MVNINIEIEKRVKQQTRDQMRSEMRLKLPEFVHSSVLLSYLASKVVNWPRGRRPLDSIAPPFVCVCFRFQSNPILWNRNQFLNLDPEPK